MTRPVDPVLAVAVRVARRAAAVITDASRDLKRLPTFSKEQGDIVSAADHEAEQAIVATIAAAFPDHAILGEESGASPGVKGDSPYRWIIDPIDGTMNFVHGLPYYAVSIALAHGSELSARRRARSKAATSSSTAIKGARRAAQRRDALRRRPPDTRTVRTRWSAPSCQRARAPACRASCQSSTASLNAARCAGPVRVRWSMAYVAAGRLDGFFVTQPARLGRRRRRAARDRSRRACRRLRGRD